MKLLDKSQILMQFSTGTMEKRIVLKSDPLTTRRIWPTSSSMLSGSQMRRRFSGHGSARPRKSFVPWGRQANKVWKACLRLCTVSRRDRSSLTQRLNSLWCMWNLKKWLSTWKKTTKVSLKQLYIARSASLTESSTSLECSLTHKDSLSVIRDSCLTSCKCSTRSLSQVLRRVHQTWQISVRSHRRCLSRSVTRTGSRRSSASATATFRTRSRTAFRPC